MCNEHQNLKYILHLMAIVVGSAPFFNHLFNSYLASKTLFLEKVGSQLFLARFHFHNWYYYHKMEIIIKNTIVVGIILITSRLIR